MLAMVRDRSLSPEALYRTIPQAPNVVSSTLPPSLDVLDNEAFDEHVGPISVVMVDARIRWIHFVLGCAVLLPWNALITATPYFLSRLEGSSLRSTFSSYLSLSFTGPSLLFLAHATATAKQVSPSRRIVLSTLGLSFLSLLLTLSTFVHVTPGLFFAFVLFNGLAQAGSGSYLQTSVIAVASLFGPIAVQAMMSGQAAVAVVVSGVQVLSAATSLWGIPDETIATYQSDGIAEESSAFLFFALSTVFLLLTTGAHQWLVTMPAYRIVVKPTCVENDIVHLDEGDLAEREGLISSERQPSVLGDKSRILRVARANVKYEFAVAYVFVVTLAVFPPITASIQPANPKTHPLLFSAVHFLVFNVGDFLGRYICAFPSVVVWSANHLLVLSLARTCFIPLFLICNIQRSATSSTASPLINSDLLFMLILFLFGCSNGYVSSLCMMSAPSLEYNPRLRGRREDVEIAATVASFCLMGGLAVGSLASFGVRAAVCGCNPFRE